MREGPGLPTERLFPTVERCEQYLVAHYPGQRNLLTCPEAIRAAYAVAREAERVRAIRLSLSAGGYDD